MSQICRHGGKQGLFLPITVSEHDLPDELRVFIYAACLVYCFFGVSIAADIFMASIEAITSRRSQRRDKSGKITTYMVWNETVANLSLMALGSSAPEIFLSVIDLLRNDFHAGDLGPSTIVGSAAFNLFVIVAVCMVAIPSGDGRAVQQVPVFVVTAIFSLLAYLWLVVIVLIHTPDEVQIWEAALTFGFLPLLVWVSWRVDKFGFRGILPGANSRAPEEQKQPELADLGPRPSAPRAPRQSSVDAVPRGNVDMKHDLIKTMIAGRGVTRVARRTVLSDRISSGSSRGTRSSTPKGQAKAQVQFLVDYQNMSRDLESKPVWLVRHGDLAQEVRVEYTVQALTSPLQAPPVMRVAPEAVEQWTAVLTAEEARSRAKLAAVSVKGRSSICVRSGEATLSSGEDQKEILVPKPLSQDFLLQLVEASSPSHDVAIGPISSSQVKTVTASARGKIRFACGQVSVRAHPTEPVKFEVVVIRVEGCSGAMSCNYRTEAISALADFHYETTEGQLDFGEGVTEACFDLQVMPVSERRCPKAFVVILDAEGCEEDVLFDESGDGGETTQILTVHIETPPGKNIWRLLDRCVNLDSLRLGNADWWDHAKGSFLVGGSLEEQRAASYMDFALHMLALPWKIFFVFAPSIHYLGGWVCFLVSLMYIGVLTSVIADLADLFGCVLDLRDMVTAITFVAIGTSMPDLFASKGAAQEDPTADASIVNVTGSNSVNVFLGLGLPWTVGAIYWEFNEHHEEDEHHSHSTSPGYSRPGLFYVAGDDLGFNVLVFSICCVLCLCVLALKRRIVGVELGGPMGVKVSIALLFVSLWFGYIALASYKALTPKSKASTGEETRVILIVTAILSVFLLVALAFLAGFKMRNSGATPKDESQMETTPRRSSIDEEKGNDSVDAAEENRGGEIRPPLVASEAPSGSRGRNFAKS